MCGWCIYGSSSYLYAHKYIYICNTIICICLCNCVYVCANMDAHVYIYILYYLYPNSGLLVWIPSLQRCTAFTMRVDCSPLSGGNLFVIETAEEVSEVMETKTDPIADMRSRFWGILKTSTFDWRLAVALSAQILAGIDQLWVTYGNLQKMKASPVHAAKHRQQRDVSLFGPIPS